MGTGQVTGYRINVREVVEGVVTGRILLAEKEPEAPAGLSSLRGRSPIAVKLRLIRPQFSAVFTDTNSAIRWIDR